MLLTQLFESDVQKPQSIDELIDLLHTECAPFFKEIGMPLYRGSKTQQPALLSKRYIRTDRKPTHTAQGASKIYDEALEDIVGFKPRTEALFTSTSQATAEFYGSVSLVFPIGDFKYMYLEGIGDLYSDIDWMVKGGEKGDPQEIKNALRSRARTDGIENAVSDADPIMGLEVLINNTNGYFSIGLDRIQEEYDLLESEVLDALFKGKFKKPEVYDADDDY